MHDSFRLINVAPSDPIQYTTITQINVLRVAVEHRKECKYGEMLQMCIQFSFVWFIAPFFPVSAAISQVHTTCAR
jgi:hypothetical protein